MSLSGSLILGFAAALDAKEAESIWEISRLDEIWQAEQWGNDDEADALAAVKKTSFLHAKLMFDLSVPEFFKHTDLTFRRKFAQTPFH